jgi:hypothetical protein
MLVEKNKRTESGNINSHCRKAAITLVRCARLYSIHDFDLYICARKGASFDMSCTYPDKATLNFYYFLLPFFTATSNVNHGRLC